MKTTLFVLYVFSIIPLTMHVQPPKDTTTVERFNYAAVEGRQNSVSFVKDGWYIAISPFYANNIGGQDEYAPAKEFYKIQTQYYPNGIIRRRIRVVGNVLIGNHEEFDESGKLIKEVDENAKFGRIKPEDIPGIIEKIGLFNTVTGENIFTKEPLPTDGRFTSRMFSELEIGFAPGGTTTDGKTYPSYWYMIYSSAPNWDTSYSIHGETGEYIKGGWEVHSID